MSDITMCQNYECGKIDYCWRANCPPNIVQSYAIFEPKNEDSDCDFFIPFPD